MGIPRPADRSFVRKLGAGLGIGLGTALFVVALTSFGALHRSELMTYDWRMRQS